MQFNIIKFLFFLFFPFILHQQLANSVSSSNSWQEDAWNEMDLEGKDMNGCIWKNYAKSEEAKTECDQLWRLYDPIEVEASNGRNQSVVMEKSFNKRKDRKMPWKHFHKIFAISQQPGIVTQSDFNVACYAVVLLNKKNGLIRAVKAVKANDPKKLEFFLFVYTVIDERNGDIYDIMPLLGGKYGTRQFSDAFIKKSIESDLKKIQNCFKWTGNTDELIRGIRRLKDQLEKMAYNTAGESEEEDEDEEDDARIKKDEL